MSADLSIYTVRMARTTVRLETWVMDCKLAQRRSGGGPLTYTLARLIFLCFRRSFILY